MFDSALAISLAGAAVAVFLGGAGSAIGVGLAGQSGSGVISEKPELFGKVLVIQALPATQGIYGLIGGILILLNVGIIGGAEVELTTGVAWQFFFASLPVGVTGLISGIHQGKVSAAGLHAVAKDASNTGKAIIMSAMVETYAIFGLLTTVLILLGIKI